jgi:hypothetical protein
LNFRRAFHFQFVGERADATQRCQNRRQVFGVRNLD